MKKLTKAEINLKEWEFEFLQRNKNCILMADLHCRGLYNNFKTEIKLDVEPYDYIFTNFDKGYVKKAKKAKVLNLLRKASEDHLYLEYVFKNSLLKMQNLDKVMNELNSKIKMPMNDGELTDLWEKFEQGYLEAMPWFYIPWYLSEENILTDKVKNKLNKYKKEIEKITDFDEALRILIFPIKKAAFQEEQELFFELLKIAEKDVSFEKDKEFKEKMQIYLKRFSFFPTFYFLPISPTNEKILIKNIKEAMKNNFKVDFEIKIKMQMENARKLKKLMQIINNDIALIKDIELARELGWVLTASVDEAHRAGSKFAPFLKKIEGSIGIKSGNIIFMTSNEIKLGLSKKGVEKIDFEKRKIGQIFACLNGEIFAEFGEKGIELSKWIEESNQKQNVNISEFKGQSASKGFVRGKIKLALLPKDSYRLKEGEILVCSMTSPDYVRAMKRAAAIITDEGGLLSHAAIMSREFGKPCIIGTKIATKVLKDGDLVEVDADKGIVRILQKNKD
ncbi:MAG: PEP-utilizing enzyme [Nanoarchaeota archaeon]